MSYDLATERSDKSFIKVPGFYFCKFNSVILFDHLKKEIIISEQDAKSKSLIQNFVKLIFNKKTSSARVFSPAKSNFSDAEYKQAVEKIKTKIFDGDFYEANLTRKFFGNCDVKNPFQIYKEITRQYKVGYGAFANLSEINIISVSPERFIQFRDRKILSRPIKGTIKSGKNSYENSKLRQILASSIKDKAENLMIVDLMRNDLSKYCDMGSVRVKNLFNTEVYKNVIHMHSDIEGVVSLKEDFPLCLINAFPPGSMTGAPKKIVIETCSNIEKCPRGLYSGILGYYHPDFADFSVVIRTLLIKKDKYEFQVGGAIVADSDPEKELNEIYAKAKPFKKHIQYEKT